MDTNNTNLKRLLTCLCCFIFISCSQPKEELPFIVIDVVKSYPVKEINLEDIADIEYVQLEFDEDFIFTGSPRLITDKWILAFDYKTGECLLFDRTGKKSHKLGKKGNGPGEHSGSVHGFSIEESTGELFIFTYEKILVFSISGEYKRTMNLPSKCFIGSMVDFDANNFLCYDPYQLFPVSFFLLSKSDGEVVKEIDIPFDRKLKTTVSRTEGETTYTIAAEAANIVLNKSGYLLADHSTDTVFLFKDDYSLTPVLVRTPPCQTMEPLIYLNSYLEAGEYYFMQSISTQYDWSTRQGFNRTFYAMSKKDGNIYEQKIIFDQYKGRDFHIYPSLLRNTTSYNMGLFNLRLSELQDALDEGKLNGKLKSMVENSLEDDNDILMLVHFK